jgi:hypothetical protein
MQSCINTWRLGIPIAYNFIQILGIEKCSFLQVMGPVQQIPFIGETINEWVFPICLFLTIFITASNAYNRLLRCFGKKHTYISSKDSETQEKVMDGQHIIDKYRKQTNGSLYDDTSNNTLDTLLLNQSLSDKFAQSAGQ